MGTGPWPEDLCKSCPRQDICPLDDPAEHPFGCPRVEDWRDAMERRAEGER
jgi:hypothetical protein